MRRTLRSALVTILASATSFLPIGPSAWSSAESPCSPWAIVPSPNPPDVDRNNFPLVPVSTNRFFPLTPGTTFFYEGEKDGVPTSNVTEVTCDTKVIMGVGVTARVVHDQAFENGQFAEDTFDWYAEDFAGNVWYFGEDSTEVATGSKEGSWEAGVDDADAGIIMEAHPQKGDRYYQEFARNVAEDQAKVISVNASANLSYPATNTHVNGLLLTSETSRLDPGIVENKYYQRDVGFVLGVGQFGSGRIAAFHPRNGHFLGYVNDNTGLPVHNDGLWALSFGNNGAAGSSDTLFFTAGLNDEADGLFGKIDVVP